MMIFPAFFALVNPVSTIANPACMKKTSAAPTRTQVVFTEEYIVTLPFPIFFFPIMYRKNICNTGQKKQTEFIQYQYNEKAQERGNSLPRLYEIKISICKTGDICIV